MPATSAPRLALPSLAPRRGPGIARPAAIHQDDEQDCAPDAGGRPVARRPALTKGRHRRLSLRDPAGIAPLLRPRSHSSQRTVPRSPSGGVFFPARKAAARAPGSGRCTAGLRMPRAAFHAAAISPSVSTSGPPKSGSRPPGPSSTARTSRAAASAWRRSGSGTSWGAAGRAAPARSPRAWRPPASGTAWRAGWSAAPRSPRRSARPPAWRGSSRTGSGPRPRWRRRPGAPSPRRGRPPPGAACPPRPRWRGAAVAGGVDHRVHARERLRHARAGLHVHPRPLARGAARRPAARAGWRCAPCAPPPPPRAPPRAPARPCRR